MKSELPKDVSSTDMIDYINGPEFQKLLQDEIDREIVNNIIEAAKQLGYHKICKISNVRIDTKNNRIDMDIGVPIPLKWIDVKMEIDKL